VLFKTYELQMQLDSTDRVHIKESSSKR